MNNGGYKIINFQGYDLTEKTPSGIFEMIKNSDDKAFQITGLNIDGNIKNDVFVEIKPVDDAFTFDAYGKTYTISEGDAIEISDAKYGDSVEYVSNISDDISNITLGTLKINGEDTDVNLRGPYVTSVAEGRLNPASYIWTPALLVSYVSKSSSGTYGSYKFVCSVGERTYTQALTIPAYEDGKQLRISIETSNTHGNVEYPSPAYLYLPTFSDYSKYTVNTILGVCLLTDMVHKNYKTFDFITVYVGSTSQDSDTGEWTVTLTVRMNPIVFAGSENLGAHNISCTCALEYV